MQPIENIVFKGGGVLGEAYAGAYEVIEPLTRSRKRVIGTSAGSLMAMMVALGYTPQEITNIVASTPFKDFMDKSSWWARLLNELHYYGLYSGDVLLKWIKTQIKNKTGSEKTTFLDLRKGGYLDLTVVATNERTNFATYFNADTDPKCIVAEALRCSIAIPFFFQPFKPTQGNFAGVQFVDGGVVNNFPISYYDSENGPNKATLGVFLYHQDEPAETPNNIIKAGEDVYASLSNSQDVLFFARKEDVARTIIIDSLGISATNFNLTPADGEALRKSGLIAAQHYFAPIL